MIKRILTGLVGSRYENAVITASLELASLHRASLSAVTAIDLESMRDASRFVQTDSPLSEKDPLGLAISEISKSIREFELRCKASQLEYSVQRERRNEPFDFLSSLARYHDLVVLSLKNVFDYEVGGRRFHDPSIVLVKLVSLGVHPIVAVPEKWRPIKRVLIAYSGSIQSAATVRRFAQLAPFGTVEQVRAVTFQPDPERGRRLLGQLGTYLRSFGIEAELESVHENPREQLLRTADAFGADAIVMGNSAGSLLRRRVLGETSLKAIRESGVTLFLSQ
ncbi:MAG: universal stress protein [Myxococcota bacterium]